MEHLKKINKLLSRSRLPEADTIRFGRQIKRRMAKRSLGAAKMRLLKQGLADARRGRLVQAKENYTKHLPDQLKRDEKPLSETNPYFRDPKLRRKMILVAAASSSAIEGIRVPQKVIAKGLRPGWKPRRTRRRS